MGTGKGMYGLELSFVEHGMDLESGTGFGSDSRALLKFTRGGHWKMRVPGGSGGLGHHYFVSG